MDSLKERIMGELSNNYLSVEEQQLNRLITYLEEADRIFFYARGREMLMLSAFAMRVHHMGYKVYVIGEVCVPPVCKGDVLVVSSGMGYGSVLTAQLQTAIQAGASIVGLTAHPENDIGKYCSHIVILSGQTLADPVKMLTSVQTMGSCFEEALLLTLDYIVLKMMQKNHWQENDLSIRHTNLE